LADYLFTSERLGFRTWQEKDIEQLAPVVMEFFPSLLNKLETAAFVKRMQSQFQRTGFCYFAVDILQNQEFIGFIGISEKDFAADFTPSIDIGWRLKTAAWKQGYATEGASRCIKYAFQTLGITSIYAIAPVVNLPSEKVMIKIGMYRLKTFQHPLLNEYPHLQECVLYHIGE